MERKGNTGLIVILLLIVVGLATHIVYNKYFVKETDNSKKECLNENVQPNNNNNNNNEVTNNNSVNENEVTELWKEAAVNNDTKSLKVVNADTKKEYMVSLTKEGSVVVKLDNKDYTLDVKGVDYLTSEYKEVGSLKSLYMLTSTGDVYEYDLNNISLNKVSATKIKSNIKNIINFSYKGYNKGGCNGLLGIDKDAKYVEIVKSCV